ncbi:MAG: alcohol dehydrogenase catalytic domain-containing protein [Planctomycetes bacterium]|nr:alcohol dehydrogenase catalytic domain-containing protein [Planctomycetota bacterium]
MKAGVIYSFDDIRVAELAIPEFADDEALIRVKACGICTGELTPWYINDKTRKKPNGYVPGHEFVGIIDKIGNNAPAHIKIGQHVFVHHHAPCLMPDCHFCSRGKYVQCPTWKKLTVSQGGMSEFVAVKNYGLLNDTTILDDKMDFETATFIEPLACSVKAVKKAEIREGDTVLIIGTGVMGILNAMLCKLSGACVILSDIDQSRVDFATKINEIINADAIVNPLKTDLSQIVKKYSDNRGADAVIVGPSSHQATLQGIDCAAPGANIVSFMSLPTGENLNVEHFKLYFQEINLIPSYSCGPDDVKNAYNLLLEGKIKVEKLITARFTIDDFPKAFKLAATGGINIKTIITF